MNEAYDKLMNYALRLLSRKRYTQAEIEKKLKLRKYGTKKDIAKVLSRLIEFKYINDLDFAKDYIQSRSKFNPKGERMLAFELKFKGIKKELVDKAIEDAKLDENKLAELVLERKKRTLKRYKSEKKREKIFALLSSRGFKIETIYKMLDKC